MRYTPPDDDLNGDDTRDRTDSDTENDKAAQRFGTTERIARAGGVVALLLLAVLGTLAYRNADKLIQQGSSEEGYRQQQILIDGGVGITLIFGLTLYLIDRAALRRREHENILREQANDARALARKNAEERALADTRQKAARRIARQEARFRALIEGGNDLILQIDISDGVHYYPVVPLPPLSRAEPVSTTNVFQYVEGIVVPVPVENSNPDAPKEIRFVTAAEAEVLQREREHADTINSGSAADTINSGSAADTINSGSAADTINSGSAADTINSGDRKKELLDAPILYASPSIIRLLGVRQKTMRITTLSDFIEGEDRQTMVAFLRGLQREAEAQQAAREADSIERTPKTIKQKRIPPIDDVAGPKPPPPLPTIRFGVRDRWSRYHLLEAEARIRVAEDDDQPIAEIEDEKEYEKPYVTREIDPLLEIADRIARDEKDKKRTITSIVLTARDITSRDREAKSAQQSEEAVRSLYQIAAAHDLSFQVKLQSLLLLGAHNLGLTDGFIAIPGERRADKMPDPLLGGQIPITFRVIAHTRGDIDNSRGSGNRFILGDELLDKSRETVRRGELTQKERFVAAPILLDDNRSAIVAFFTDPETHGDTSHTGQPPTVLQNERRVNPRPQKPLTAAQRGLLQLMAQWAGGEILRQRSEDALKRSETRLIEAQRLANLGAWEFDLRNRVIEWNDALYTQWGRDPALGPPSFDEYRESLHEDDRAEIVAAIEGAIRDGGTYALEHRIVRPGGEVRHISATGSAIANSDGQVVKLVGTTLDITERQRSIEQNENLLKQVRANGERLRQIMRRVNCLIWEADVREVPYFYDVNDPHRPGDTDRDDWFDENAGTVLSWDLRMADEDMAMRWLPVAAVPGQPFVSAWYWSRPDEDRKTGNILTAEALKASAKDGSVTRYEQEFRVLLANGQTRWLREMVDVEFVGREIDRPSAAPRPESVDLPDDRSAPIPGDFSLPALNDSERSLARLMSAPTALRHWRLVGVSVDSTSAKALEEALVRSNQELTDFAAIASHDLQEPLRKIQTLGDMLRRKAGANLDESASEYLNRMQSAANRMQGLITDLLNYSRVTSAARPFAVVDLSQIAAEVVDDLEARITRTGGRVVLPADLPTIDADPMQMRQLFQNLLGNALKYHKPDVPPIVTVDCEIVPNGNRANQGFDGGNRANQGFDGGNRANQGFDGGNRANQGFDGSLVRLRFADNGIGFDNADAERVFQVFERLEGHSKYEGTGVGLAIVRKIVQRHGGTVSATSQIGVGSVFTVELPTKNS